MSAGSMHEEPARERACAIVSPISGEIVFTVPGNAAPVLAAPAYAELNRPLRPCTGGAVPAGEPTGAVRVWQPLHSSTSPGRTLSQARWITLPVLIVLMRRPFTSSRLNWNAMFAGT